MFLDDFSFQMKPIARAAWKVVAPRVTPVESEMLDAIAAGHRRHEQRKNAQIMAAPMRALFDQLARGEVDEIDGVPVLAMPDNATAAGISEDEPGEWVPIAPAIEGWADCWAHIDASLSTYNMRVLAAQLRDGKPITPRLVEKAREEFERQVAHTETLPPGSITSASTTTQIVWELERIEKEKAAENGRKI